MIIVECEQGSESWFNLRLGLPTASIFGKIVTFSGKKSQTWKSMVNKLVAEKLRGKPDDGFQSDWMKRGHEVEPKAIDAYSFIHGIEVRRIGLFYRDERKDVAASPDGLMERGGLEAKCPSPGVHVGYLLGKEVPAIYKTQVFGSLYLSDLDYWDFMSYHPDMVEFIVRTDRDNKEYQGYAEALDKYLPQFISETKKAFELLR